MMRTVQRRFLSSTSRLCSHENPLGLPRTGTPPALQSRRGHGLPAPQKIKNVRKIIAVSSAKGGVGKSTIAVNLALSLVRGGLQTGILDTDIFGPSIPTLLRLDGEPRLSEDNQLIPLSNYGLKSMSIGYLVPQDSAIVWRGLMVTKALQQLLHEVAWGSLDVLVLDLPPGTGDVQLTVTQHIALDGAIIVSTPQDIALKDAMRGYEMFKKVKVPILGMVQNMSSFTCPTCSSTHSIFGNNGLRRMCEKLETQLLCDIPLDARICEDADKGKPTVVAEPQSQRAKVYDELAATIRSKLGV